MKKAIKISSKEIKCKCKEAQIALNNWIYIFYYREMLHKKKYVNKEKLVIEQAVKIKVLKLLNDGVMCTYC